MWKKRPTKLYRLTSFLFEQFPSTLPFWGFFGAAFASSPSHSWWVLRYTAWLSLTPSLHHGTRPWYQDPPAGRFPPPPPPPHETHLGVGWFRWAWDRFKKKKNLGKNGKNVGEKTGEANFRSFFWWKETKSFVKKKAWIMHTSCNEDYYEIHVENNFEGEYQLFIDFFTSH